MENIEAIALVMDRGYVDFARLHNSTDFERISF
jgi:hypothetical protein